MTKEEVKKIQRLESHAWDLLMEAEYKYVKANFPFGYGYEQAQRTNYFIENKELYALSYSWNVFASVMSELGIPTEYSKKASEYSNLTIKWLKGE